MSGLPALGRLRDRMIELREWGKQDLEAVMAGRDLDEKAAIAWLRQQRERPWSLGISLAIAPPGEPAIGYAGLIRRPRLELGADQGPGDTDLVFDAHRRIAGIGYWVLPAAQGQGAATRAVGLLSRWALESAGMTRIEALVDPSNVPSCRVVEKNGFQFEGRLRGYLVVDDRPTDASAYSLLPSDL